MNQLEFDFGEQDLRNMYPGYQKEMFPERLSGPPYTITVPLSMEVPMSDMTISPFTGIRTENVWISSNGVHIRGLKPWQKWLHKLLGIRQ